MEVSTHLWKQNQILKEDVTLRDLQYDPTERHINQVITVGLVMNSQTQSHGLQVRFTINSIMSRLRERYETAMTQVIMSQNDPGHDGLGLLDDRRYLQAPYDSGLDSLPVGIGEAHTYSHPSVQRSQSLPDVQQYAYPYPGQNYYQY